MSLLNKSVKCGSIKINTERHFFDIKKASDLVLCTCRCGKKSSGFPDAGTDMTRSITYTKNTRINMSGIS